MRGIKYVHYLNTEGDHQKFPCHLYYRNSRITTKLAERQKIINPRVIIHFFFLFSPHISTLNVRLYTEINKEGVPTEENLPKKIANLQDSRIMMRRKTTSAKIAFTPSRQQHGNDEDRTLIMIFITSI